MPEGDTIHRTAESLRRVLVGRDLVGFEAPRLAGPLPTRGTVVVGVEARGKHLLLRFGDGLILHTHQRMTGSWHLYRPGEAWARPRSAARVVVQVPGVIAVCFHSPVVEVLDEAALARHPSLRALGPDLCDPDLDLDAATARMRRLDSRTLLADALLDQRVACGVGNVYKSEVCFLHGLHPATPLRALAPGQPGALLKTAADLLRRNLEGARRTTVAGARAGTLYVYGRHGRPCRRCGTAIATADVGARPRVTWWCPRCQSAP